MTTISTAYREMQRQLHANPNYGIASGEYAPLVKLCMESMQLRSLSDYGAGKQRLKQALNELGLTGFEYLPYDPAFPEYGEPRSADLVCCIDVLEHIEPDYLDAVMADLARITIRVGLFTIAPGPAAKTLPDGRNAHLIQQPSSWWLPRLCNDFEIMKLDTNNHGFWCVVIPRLRGRVS
jgi:hypothetical protein